MPLFDFLCKDCGHISEVLVSGTDDEPKCQKCNGLNLEKLVSAPSSFSGNSSNGLPGLGDTTCCGSAPGHSGCAGPGSCCGKA